MLCDDPYTNFGGQAFPCRKCLPCLQQRARTWSSRIVLEAAMYTDNAFVTLTYDDANLIFSNENGHPTLVPKHVQDWLKRLRKRIAPIRVRYFLVGEYGDESLRPHYHAALFGLPTCRYGETRGWKDQCCSSCELVRETWGFGRVFLGNVEIGSARYVAGYVTKKMHDPTDRRLDGRYPEFARMSLRPGIGADFMHDVASELMHFNLDSTQGDVPSSLRHGGRLMPLGRYLRRRLRRLIGRDENAPQEVMDAIAEELQPLRLAARNSKTQPSFSRAIVEANRGRVASVKARAAIYKKRGAI